MFSECFLNIVEPSIVANYWQSGYVKPNVKLYIKNRSGVYLCSNGFHDEAYLDQILEPVAVNLEEVTTLLSHFSSEGYDMN